MSGWHQFISSCQGKPWTAEEGLQRRVTQLGNIYATNVLFNTQSTFIPRRGSLSGRRRHY
jgi:hypothetical protein